MNANVRLSDVIYDVVIELAALIPNPADPGIEDWPCSNRADRECLQRAYIAAYNANEGESTGVTGVEENEPKTDYFWRMYQDGRASADHTSKQAFEQTLQRYAAWVVREKQKQTDDGPTLNMVRLVDEEMANDVCSSIEMHGHDRCTSQAEWNELNGRQNWVRALLAERDALRAKWASISED